MRPLISFVLLFFTIHSYLLSQNSKNIIDKPPIDTSVFDKWPSVRDPSLSNDGKYALYKIYNQPLYSNTIVVHGLNGKLKEEIIDVSSALFTEDSKKVIFIRSDSLCILTLSNSNRKYIPNVKSFRIFMHGKNEFLCYLLNNIKRELILLDLKSGKQKSYADIQNYFQSDDGNVLVIQKEFMKDSITKQQLCWLDLSGDTIVPIWEGLNIANVIFDGNNQQIAFIAEGENGNSSQRSIYYYKVGYKAMPLVNDQSLGIGMSFKIDYLKKFSNDGKNIFFSIKEEGFLKSKSTSVKVDIWSYKDVKLQSQQLKELFLRNYLAVINVGNRKIIRLEREGENIRFFDSKIDDVVLMTKNNGGDSKEMNWNKASHTTGYLVNTNSGSKVEINIFNPYSIYLSPDGKYVIGLDNDFRNFYSYERETKIAQNITHSLSIPLNDNSDFFDWMEGSRRGLLFAGWVANKKYVLIYDKYDIWQVDLTGKESPVNITNGYGRKHNIAFRISWPGNKVFSQNEKLLLSAFNRDNKNNGFYRKVLNQKGDPEMLTMGSYVYDVFEHAHFGGMAPIKARDSEIYLVRRCNASKSPNYFFTGNFKTFNPLSNIYPEKTYNWLTSELISWKTFDGTVSQGILYKPENFDSTKKYPIIFLYYEKMSDGLNEYKVPEAPGDRINIPLFVSRGYLVFTPDIHYKIGEPGQSAVNSVVSAAKYLSQKPWVDSNKMGLQGHSFGGYETNVIITRTNIFAAACSASGYADLINSYGAIMYSSGVNFGRYSLEVGQGRIGATLWERPDLYIENSPIFKANKIDTPLLMMNNKEDGVVNFSQGVEFFTALRRLGKKVWMLQYDGEVHSIFKDKKATLDYTIRLNQFFDHYLRDASAPIWMTKGIPAFMKGINDGLELDYEIKIP